MIGDRMFSCVFITLPYDALGQVWFLLVSIPDLCPLPYCAMDAVERIGYE